MAVKQLPKLSELPEPPDRLSGDQERFDAMAFDSLKAQKKMVNEDLNKTFIPKLNEFAVDVNASADAAAQSERNAAASAATATDKADEASASAAAAGTQAGESAKSAAAAKTSETNAAASKTAAAKSATNAANAQKAAEAARDEAQNLANVGYASQAHAGLAKVDGTTTQADAGGMITVRDVAIGGDAADLASARGQIGNAVNGAPLGTNLNDYAAAGTWFFTNAHANDGLNFPVNLGGFLVASCNDDGFSKPVYVHQAYYQFNAVRVYERCCDSGRWSAWSEILGGNAAGSGLRFSNGLLSVPEYSGATASAPGTSGLVPPAAAGEQDLFLTGGGDYKPALSLAGGVLSGSIQINDPANDIAVAPPANTERGLFLGDKNSVIMGGFDVMQHASDNAKRTQMFAKNASGAIASIAAVTHEDGTKEISTDCPMQISDVQIERLFADSVRLIKFSGARGKEGLAMRYSPDSGELYLDGRAMHGKADTAGYADAAGSANALGGKAESALSVAYARDSGAMNGKAESALSVGYATNAGHAETAQNAYGLTGMEMIIARTTYTLPNYGTWKYIYMIADSSHFYDLVIGEDPGGTVLSASAWGADAFMDGMAFRSA